MDKTDEQPDRQATMVERKLTITAMLILGFVGYALIFTIIMISLAVTGKSSSYSFYVPLSALPGAIPGPLVIYILRRRLFHRKD
jgi:hypothetical protein